VPVPPGLPWTRQPPDRFWLWSLQTALRTIDPLIVPDGRWTRRWRAQLRAARLTLSDPGAAASGAAGERVTATLWNNALVQAGFWADPWADGGPTETDLVERIYGMATPRTGGVNARARSPASLAVLRRPYRLHVCLHHRGRESLLAQTLAIVVLRFQLPANAATWAALPAVVLPPPALTALRGALDALVPVLPAGLPLPAGWVAVAVRRPNRPVATGAPVVVTFDVDFSADPPQSQWMFVALAHSTSDPLTLAGAGLSDMILGSRHAAARSVQVI
jgi:hypothetical protein